VFIDFVMNFGGFLKMLENFWAAAQLPESQQRLFSTKLFSCCLYLEERHFFQTAGEISSQNLSP
jgi:hypothetical protein